jgi:hypothetical protein
MKVGDGTYPKMHAFAKMPHNMLKFGSANNFSGQAT